MNTLSKLTFADSKRFHTLISDVFLGVNRSFAQFEELQKHLETAAEQMGIHITHFQRNKVIELYEQLRQRIGVVIFGPPGSGLDFL